MKISQFTKITLIFSMAFTTTVLYAQSKSDTLAIQTIIQDETSAWNKGDAIAYSKQFAQDGTFTNIVGMFYTGHKAFLYRHDEIFKGMFNKTTSTQKIVSLRFVRPDVAIVETLCRVTGFPATGLPARIQLDAKGRLTTRLLQVLEKSAGNWQIVSYHNVDVKPGAPVPEDQ
ncbi:SgcJ/EcaC family oxidoreductase [Spirosoma sp. HMF4905]|uniref:SgcJ/EcaC family oxidoreductase n=1 Tax=Spirosoma arboris TaxID=2682092 RepID=A0A7K1SLX8_9BACT|nr:SgcJ/EcaC family oxidoreductase [Spirosoma arboris]MVM34810.1 SgcJ/EcaC family oxidoreductase [Spirosoma arboris]